MSVRIVETGDCPSVRVSRLTLKRQAIGDKRMARYDFGTPEFYDFELKKQRLICDAIQLHAISLIKDGGITDTVDITVIAGAIEDSDRRYQGILSDLERSVNTEKDTGSIAI